MDVLDAGCGTGVASAAFAKMNVKSVLALDKSEAMLDKAKFGNQKNPTVTYRLADLNNPSALSGGEVSHAACLYFTIYYLPDKEAFFRNMFLWVKPGGQLVVEVVNKYKFDPMLESASPLVGFSLQKYSKKRLTESNVVFDKFTYTGHFDLVDPQAEFIETFRFKDGTIRRQKHKMTMPTMEEIVKMGQAAGWVYQKYVDLVVVGFEYSYLLFFRHP
jgi:ubiquinone/menaquinone biosynthesis C-methylase UbiE